MKKIALIFFVVVTLIILSSCDSGLTIKEISIEKYPDRITYIIGRDTALDLSGCEIKVITKDGSKSIECLNDSHFKELYTVNENIDFSKKGVYEVIISRAILNCSFAIEVIEIQ